METKFRNRVNLEKKYLHAGIFSGFRPPREGKNSISWWRMKARERQCWTRCNDASLSFRWTVFAVIQWAKTRRAASSKSIPIKHGPRSISSNASRNSARSWNTFSVILNPFFYYRLIRLSQSNFLYRNNSTDSSYIFLKCQ